MYYHNTVIIIYFSKQLFSNYYFIFLNRTDLKSKVYTARNARIVIACVMYYNNMNNISPSVVTLVNICLNNLFLTGSYSMAYVL